MIRGYEFHTIIENVFSDVKNIGISEQIQVNCPRCQERDDLPYPDGKYNLEINTGKRVFRCWKCDEPKFSGSLGSLIRMFGTPIDYKVYKSFANSYNDYNEKNVDEVETIVELPNEMIFFSEMVSGDNEHFKAYNYLVNERLINRDTILKYNLGFCTYGLYRNRIIFPSYDINGNINYFIGRSYDIDIKNPYKNPKANKDNIIFNEGLINWDSTIYLVEGVFDMLALPNAIPLLGKTIPYALYSRLKKQKPNIILVLDPDAYKNAIDIFFTLQNIYVGYENRIKIVKLPTDNDIDEIRRCFGYDKIINILHQANSLTNEDYFIKKMGNYGRYGFNK